MSALKNLVGQKFGRLTVIERAENKGEKVCWRCRCDCGNEVIVKGCYLHNRDTQSCGCLHNERLSERNSKHGMRYDPLYTVHYDMIQRTTNPKNKAYKCYGGRGIKVCERWHNFKHFREDVSKLPHYGEKNYSFDRIDNNGDYCPENVRWADKKTQARNRRTNILIEHKGGFVTLKELSELTGINYGTLRKRYHSGDRDERLIRPIETKYRPVKNNLSRDCLRNVESTRAELRNL